MPKTKFQDIVLTAIMAIVMVYGMIVYNVALNTGGVTGKTFLLAFHELYIMAPIAFILEFFIVGKIARKLAFTVLTPKDNPHFITYTFYYLCNKHLHLLYNVPNDELNCNILI